MMEKKPKPTKKSAMKSLKRQAKGIVAKHLLEKPMKRMPGGKLLTTEE